MTYALNLNMDNRILSACVVLTNGNYVSMPIVDTLPEGNLPDYRYVNGEYVYDPLPVEEVITGPQEPTLEERIEVLETTTDDMVLLMAELIGG